MGESGRGCDTAGRWRQFQSSTTRDAAKKVNVTTEQGRRPPPPIQPNWWKLSTSPAASTPNDTAVPSAAIQVARRLSRQAGSSAASKLGSRAGAPRGRGGEVRPAVVPVAQVY